jgi:hypothetical protein
MKLDENYFEITHWHTTLGIDAIYIGLNLYKMNDLDLLIEWYNQVGKYMDSLVDGQSSKEKELSQLNAVLWICINRLHPKPLLRFRDIRKPVAA